MKILIGESQIKTLLEDITEKKQYIGQCDLLRHESKENEEKWQHMMKIKKTISFKKFISSVNMKEMLDDDVTPKQYIQDCIREDDETKTYISKWGNEDCMFLNTSGFEFIFI